MTTVTNTTRDSQVFDLIAKEQHRQESGIELIASENFVSPAVMEAAAAQAYSALTPTAVLLSQRLIGAKVFTK